MAAGSGKDGGGFPGGGLETVYLARARIKQAFARLCRQAGGIEGAATLTRIGKSQLARAASPHEPTTFPPADVIVDLESYVAGLRRRPADHPMVTRALAAAAGFDLVALPEARARRDWIDYLARVSKETGELLAKAGEALADGDISSAEIAAARLIDEAEDMIRAAVEIRAALIARLTEGRR